MKFCKDCNHALPDRSIIFWFQRHRWIFARCAAAPERHATIDDLVAGPKYSREYKYCSIEREFGACGLEGKKFSPRKNPQ